MNSKLELPLIERPEFFNGQRLFANDFNAMDSFNREFRWLHNRSLHTWGIGSGFQVSGTVGDREVNITPGYALDNSGREIILLETRTVPVPPVAADEEGNPIKYYLTVHYRPDEDLEETETRQGVCKPADFRGTIRRREEPVFCWIELDPSTNKPLTPDHRNQITSGEKIVLAQVSVKNCQIELPVSLFQRRNARPSSLPYIACGKTTEQNTTWQKWTVSLNERDILVGVKTEIDTSSARFSRTPCYTARIAGNRFFKNDKLDPPYFFLNGFPQINGTMATNGGDIAIQAGEETGPDHFTLRVFMPQFTFTIFTPTPSPTPAPTPTPPPTSTLDNIDVNPRTILTRDDFTQLLQNEGNWHVIWMGVQE
jgi:hypothetical protein